MSYVKIACLFLLFSVSLWFVRALDARSQLYVDCAEIWVDKLEQAKTSQFVKSHLQEIRQGTSELRYQNEICPALIPAHQRMVDKKIAF